MQAENIASIDKTFSYDLVKYFNDILIFPIDRAVLEMHVMIDERTIIYVFTIHIVYSSALVYLQVKLSSHFCR